MSRANYRKTPTSVVSPTGRTGRKRPKKPQAEKSTTPGRGKKIAKALKGALSDQAAIEAAQQDDFAATSAELSNLRLRNQQSAPGRAQAIIKNRRA